MISDVDCLDVNSLTTDICVVGAGAAGITIARELDGRGTRVLVLESGRRAFEPRTQNLYRSHVVGLPHGGVHGYRYRVFGGSTTRWAGQALPLSATDLSYRPWIADSGWPIALPDLAPYYARASAVMGIQPFPSDSDTSAWPTALAPPPSFDPSLVRSRFSQFSPRPNFAELYGADLAKSTNVQVVLGANVTELVPDPHATQLDLVVARSLDGRSIEVRASHFVLCMGGLETPRLLLASDRYCDGGVGNSYDLVGRYFQDHPGLAIGTISPRAPKQFQRIFQPRRKNKVTFFPSFSAGDKLQQLESLVSASGSIEFGGQSPSAQAAKTLLRAIRAPEFRPKAPSAAITLVGNPVPAVRAAYRHFVLRQPARETSGIPTLNIGGEQVPNGDSRVHLSDDCDELGVRRLVLDWRVTGQDLRSWRRFAEVVGSEFERLEMGSAELELDKLPDDPTMASELMDAGHHMGTTRMSADPHCGVVDRNCQVHGFENLFVASSSVFPTGGSSNPTYTIIALALRLADHLSTLVAPSEERHAS